ncbi:MAG: hypothetical protein KJO82_06755, partial [Gammaproteobacteria bacterium]|nr:hypothetical protein [Gammaproteobacteria bacterium]
LALSLAGARLFRATERAANCHGTPASVITKNSRIENNLQTYETILVGGTMVKNPNFSNNNHAIRTLLLLACSLPVAMPASGQDAASMPAGEGRDLVAEQCVSCHAMSTALAKRASQEVWAETVDRMISIYRAPINDADQATIVSYLAEHFGEESSYNPGQQMLAEQCFRCHGDGMWRDLKTDREGWVSALYRMIGRGGVWTEDQINVMADYLAATYPPGADQ